MQSFWQYLEHTIEPQFLTISSGMTNKNVSMKNYAPASLAIIHDKGAARWQRASSDRRRLCIPESERVMAILD